MPKDEVELLLGADWDIPLTETLVADVRSGVRRGVRRRRVRRHAVVGAVAAVLAFAVVFGVSGSGTSTLVVPPATPPVSDAADGSSLDGFRIGYVPSGVRAVAGDGSFTCAVSAAMRECRDASAGGAAATLSQRRYDKANGGAWLWITVMRPVAVPSGAGRTTQWLVDWLTAGRDQVSTSDTPAGRLRVLATTGSGATSYSAVITTAGGLVISIDGNAGLTREVVTRVARSITRVR